MSPDQSLPPSTPRAAKKPSSVRHTRAIQHDRTKTRGTGTILMIASMAGIYGFAGEPVYCATKFAQVGIARAP